jgi:hypothetical protein
MADDVIDAQGGVAIIHGDGTVEVRPLTPEEIAQRDTDATAAAALFAASQAAEARITDFRADPDRADFLNQLKTATLAQTSVHAQDHTDASTWRPPA